MESAQTEQSYGRVRSTHPERVTSHVEARGARGAGGPVICRLDAAAAADADVSRHHLQE